MLSDAISFFFLFLCDKIVISEIKCGQRLDFRIVLVVYIPIAIYREFKIVKISLNEKLFDCFLFL